MKASLIRIGSLALAAALAFCLMGCSASQSNPSTTTNQNDNQTTQDEEQQETEEEQMPKYAVGESVETPLVRFTLDRAELAVALDRSMTVGVDAPADGFAGGTFLLPKEYDATEDADNPFVAGKGHTLVSLTFTVENLDRTSVDLFNYAVYQNIPVKYADQTYKGEIKFRAENENGEGWKDYISSNILLSAGETSAYKAYIDIPVEIDNLSSPFEIAFTLPTSISNERIDVEQFQYSVN